MCRKKVQVVFVAVVVVVVVVVVVFAFAFALSVYHVSILGLRPKLYVTYFPCCLSQG
jgi:hypothetical protein